MGRTGGGETAGVSVEGVDSFVAVTAGTTLGAAADTAASAAAAAADTAGQSWVCVVDSTFPNPARGVQYGSALASGSAG